MRAACVLLFPVAARTSRMYSSSYSRRLINWWPVGDTSYPDTTLSSNSAARIADANFQALDEDQLRRPNRDAPPSRRRFRRIQQKIHQHLRKLVRIGSDVRKIRQHLILQNLAAQDRLVLQKRDRIHHQARQIDLAEQRRRRASRSSAAHVESTKSASRPRCTARSRPGRPGLCSSSAPVRGEKESPAADY